MLLIEDGNFRDAIGRFNPFRLCLSHVAFFLGSF